MTSHVHIVDRRARKPNEKLQFWVNITATLLLGVPMLIEPLRGELPEHWYGVLSSVVAVLNAGIGAYRLYLNKSEIQVEA